MFRGYRTTRLAKAVISDAGDQRPSLMLVITLDNTHQPQERSYDYVLCRGPVSAFLFAKRTECI